MSSKTVIIALVALTLALSPHASAVEYKTLKEGETLATSPTSIIEITSHGGSSYGKLEIHLPTVTTPPLNGFTVVSGGGMVPLSRIGNIITGAESITANSTWVTVKITPGAEINAVGPTSVLVLPENAMGNYDLVVDSSQR